MAMLLTAEDRSRQQNRMGRLLRAVHSLPFWRPSPFPAADCIVEGAIFTRGGGVHLVHLSQETSRHCFYLITRAYGASDRDRSIHAALLQVQGETTNARVLFHLGDSHVAVATTIPWCPHCGVDEAVAKGILRDFRIAVEAVDRSLQQASR